MNYFYSIVLTFNTICDIIRFILYIIIFKYYYYLLLFIFIIINIKGYLTRPPKGERGYLNKKTSCQNQKIPVPKEYPPVTAYATRPLPHRGSDIRL